MLEDNLTKVHEWLTATTAASGFPDAVLADVTAKLAAVHKSTVKLVKASNVAGA